VKTHPDRVGLTSSGSRIAARDRPPFGFVLLVGVLSFFGDFTYEGARSVLGPFLLSLHATATVVGVVAGLGELLGYTLRLGSGKLADTTGRHWTIATFGYVVQMTSVPALALASTWPMAAALIVLERVGKAIRNPPRDVMLSRAADQLGGGYGWVFGVHESLDQFGAMCGPLAVALVLARSGDYRLAFATLAVPAALNLCLLIAARALYPGLAGRDSGRSRSEPRTLPRRFWIYLCGAGLVAAGLADYPIIAYHWSVSGTVAGKWIAAFYAVAMATSGTGSLVLGRLFDRFGFSVLITLTFVAALFAPLVFLGGFWMSLVGAAIWGLCSGVHESIIPAAVAPMAPSGLRATAFGTFTAGYGIAWFLGSSAIGVLYDRSPSAAVTFCVVTPLLALPFLALAGRSEEEGRP